MDAREPIAATLSMANLGHGKAGIAGFRGFCDVIDLVGTSRNSILEARVGIEPA